MKTISTSLRILGLVAIAMIGSAHVGSSNAYYDGPAGPYNVRVIIRTPGVIPGLAQISVRVTAGEGVRHVTVRPVRSDAGLAGAPPADTAVAVPGDPDLYSAELWLMTAGSYSVHVRVEGDVGAGAAFVPVVAVAERRLAMGIAMAVALLGAGLFLFFGAVSIFGAAVRESVLPPGQEPDAGRHRRGKVAMVGGGALLALLLVGGGAWWDDVDAAYRERIFQPLSTSTSIRAYQGARVLTLTIDDDSWQNRRWSPLIPDHGKLMHMFLVRGEDLSAFAHLHPISTDSSTFAVRLPVFLGGSYRIYADIVHESGFAQTLTDTVIAPDVMVGTRTVVPPRDPDDSWTTTAPFGEATSTTSTLPSGRTMTWERGDVPLGVDRETVLRFAVHNPDGSPAALEPYMGMMSHAAVTRDDGSVFIHLHPTGTISMAAKMRFERAEQERAGEPEPDAAMTMSQTAAEPNVVTLPFEFPEPGPYRIWVQVKVDGEVETGVWDVEVANDAG